MQTFSRLQKLHICPTRPTINKVVDIVRSDHTKDLVAWKQDIQQTCSTDTDSRPCKRALKLESVPDGINILHTYFHVVIITIPINIERKGM